MDAEKVIKALECCGDKICKHCPNYSEDIECSEKLIKEALDLIKRQQAQLHKEQNKNSKVRNERNRFKAEVERLNYYLDCYNYVFGDVRPRIKEIKDEAYKEFADLFKKEMRNCANAEFDGIKYYLIGEEFVNRRLKELTEGSNGE